MSYSEFIKSKSQSGRGSGFKPIYIPDSAFDFQKHLIDWAIWKGRAAILAGCGLGKTLMQLAWADNVVKHTNRPVILATPIAVNAQTLEEAGKFGIEAARTRNGEFDRNKKLVWITNYEQLHHYDPKDFAGFVGDESGCVKDFASERKKELTEFTRELPYRLLCTATAAPNDYFELGNTSEVLGYLGFRDMITHFFKQETTKDYLGWGRTKYRFRGHAEQPFWQWVCSFSRSLQKPSDLGFSDERYELPGLFEEWVVVESKTPRPGHLFPVPARTMQEERAERRHTLIERCERLSRVALEHDGPTLLWVDLNDEGDTVQKMVPGSVQVTGSMPDEQKEEYLLGFAKGEFKDMVIKAKIGAWGLNYQNCHRIGVLPTHSFEQLFQLIHRCYRFGQTKDVHATLILSEGEIGIRDNIQRKQRQSQFMFESIVRHMNDAIALYRDDSFPEPETIPLWMAGGPSNTTSSVERKFCPKGHELVGDNVKVSRDRVECRECHRERVRKYDAKNRRKGSNASN